MISKKRRALTTALLKALIEEYDSACTIARLLDIPAPTVQSWVHRGNISDYGLKLISGNEKMSEIYNRDEFADIRSGSWY